MGLECDGEGVLEEAIVRPIVERRHLIAGGRPELGIQDLGGCHDLSIVPVPPGLARVVAVRPRRHQDSRRRAGAATISMYDEKSARSLQTGRLHPSTLC